MGRKQVKVGQGDSSARRGLAPRCPLVGRILLVPPAEAGGTGAFVGSVLV